jgi:hypothetical protein
MALEIDAFSSWGMLADAPGRPVGSPRLQDVRRRTAEWLREQVRTLTAAERVIARDDIVDHKTLRGVPVAGLGVDGAIPGIVPGAHLESSRTTKHPDSPS